MLRLFYSLSRLEQWLVGLSITFIALSCLTLIVLILSRLLKTIDEVRRNQLCANFQEDINAITINQLQPPSAADFHIARLRKMIGSSGYAAQTFIEQLQALHKSLLGSTAQVLSETYKRLDLHLHSLKNLRSLKWEKRAKAINELAQMEITESAHAFAKFVSSSHSELREVSFLGQLRLGKESSLQELTHYKHSFSPWMRMRLFQAMQTLNSRQLPPFKQWFNHPNVEVALFAVSMVRQYQQSDAVPELVNLLKHPDRKMRGLALETLGLLGAEEHTPQLVEFGTLNWEDEKISLRVVRCLGRLASKNELPAIQKYLSHPAYSVRFQAALSLSHLEGGMEQLNHALEKDPGLGGIVRHVKDPLLTA